MIDGGKGQLSSALKVLENRQVKLPAIGLAKQFEEIIIKKDWPYLQLNRKKIEELGGTVLENDEFLSVRLPHSTHIIKLLQRIRDESHRFAVSYHTVLKTKRQVSSLLDDIPTIGPETRKKLLRTFGSYKGIEQARDAELAKVVGDKKATILRQYLRSYNK
jgi:excinuclease ABC subunit C